MYTDLHGPALLEYRSAQTDPADFDEFWRSTLAAARSESRPAELAPVDTPLDTLDVFDVDFSGSGGERIKGWLRVPAGASSPLPTIVEFVGYDGGRGLAEDSLFWASCGYAHLQMDTRGQGSGWSRGDTADTGPVGPHVRGMMTAGVEHQDTYYYRRLITDAVLLLELAGTLPLIDAARIVAIGTSQGGGLALAATALSGVAAQLVASVPFLCDFPRAITITDRDPYNEISRYLATHRGRDEQVGRTLQYFDGVNFARRGTTPAVFTTALMDATCPPSTVLGAYNAYVGEKRLRVWTHNGHEGGGRDDDLLLARHWRRHGVGSLPD